MFAIVHSMYGGPEVPPCRRLIAMVTEQCVILKESVLKDHEKLELMFKQVQVRVYTVDVHKS